MSFGEHLEDLRTHVLRALYGFLLMVLLALVFQDGIMAVATWPHRSTMARIEHERRPEAAPDPSSLRLKVLAYPESIMAHIKLALIAAAFLSSPWLFFQIWTFVAVGLYPHERKYVNLFAPLTLGLFAAGALFGYYALIPLGLYYLATFGGDLVEMSFTLDNYLDLFLTLTLVVGLSFELPLVMLFVAKIGLANAAAYRRHWRIAVLLAFVVAAVATPGPDPISQLLMAAPLVGLYFGGIALCRWLGAGGDSDVSTPAPDPPAAALP
ncbi:MAG: twin-arginine translocase subunit TatC [Planctomycetes bacterium]|nr:twin-arginine translocase subunit TatC [Planctomycetota bacterium]